MQKENKYYLVDEAALPEIFLKVAEAKRLLSTGQVKTVNDAAIKTGISRSAFYKYRDAVFPFQTMMHGRVITFQLLIHDEPGMLARILEAFTTAKANIMTINSIVPTNGCAVVTISAETLNMKGDVDTLLKQMRQTKGVVKAQILAG